MINSFLMALQFLTLIPVKVSQTSRERFGQSLIYFPVVGLLLGLSLALLSLLLARFDFPALSANMLIIVLQVVLTGGLHLDGLSDTCDAIFSGKNREQMLAIMRDPRAGVMGVLGIVCVLLLKLAFLNAVSVALRPAAIILMCTLGRWSLVLAMWAFPYARAEGKAKDYIEGLTPRIVGIATLICLLIAVLFKGLWVMILVAGVAYLIGVGAKKKLGGITGDVLGATNEMAEVTVLALLSFAC